MTRIPLLVALIVAACGSPPPEKKVADPVVAPEVASIEHPDLPPMYPPVETTKRARDLGTQDLAAGASMCTKTHCFIRVAWADKQSQVYALQDSPHAVFASNGVIRVVGPKLPKSLQFGVLDPAPVVYRAPSEGHGRISVTIPESMPNDKALEAEFWKGMELEFDRRRTPFSALAAANAQVRGGVTRPRQSADLYETMSIYTGMTSVREALQADRVLVPVKASKPTLPIADIEGVPLPPHPWDEMIGELPNKPIIEPLASDIPPDMAYVHFSDLRDFVRLARDIDGWLTPGLSAVESSTGPSHFMERYERMLVIERTGLAEALGHIATDGVAMTTSDPFVREGSDLSLVFKVRNRAALVSALGQFEANARKDRPDLQEAFWKDGDVIVRRLFTPDGAIEQNRVELGDNLIVSNSRGAIRAFVATHKGGPNLAEQGDFRYMRARYPFVKEEAGFVFLSDTFVARAVSPTVKILQGRRMAAQADLFVVQYAALLHGWMEGKTPSSINDVVSAGFLRKDQLKHPDGQAIAFDTQTGAVSAWGRPAFLTPIRDLSVDKVTQEEAQAYEQFRQTYQNYWRAFIDPVGVQITKTGETGWAIDARILPLIDNTDYNELVEMVGTTQVEPALVRSGAQFTFAIGENARLRRELDGVSRMMVPGRDFSIGWLGDWVTVGVESRSGLWDALVATNTIPNAVEQLDQREMAKILSRLPLYAGAHVANSIALGGFLATLKGFATDAAPGLIQWEQVPHYRDIPIVRVGTNPGAPEGDFAIFYAIHNDVFVLAIERATLEIQIDRIIDGEWPKASTGSAQQTQTSVSAVLGNSWLTTSLLAAVERELHSEYTRAAYAYEDLARGLPGVITPENVATLGPVYLGFEPRAVHGGAFALQDGLVTHPVYGTFVDAVFPKLPIEGSPLTAALQSTQGVGASLDFEGQGNHRGLRVRAHLGK